MSSRTRNLVAAATVVAGLGLPAVAVAVSPSSPAADAASCGVAYAENQWSGGFTADVTITNTGTSAINGWTLGFSFPGDSRITNTWNATATQTGQAVSARSMGYNSSIAPGANASFGFQGTFTANNDSPTSFTINGAVCDGSSGATTTTPPTTGPTTTGPTTTVPPTTGSTTTTTPPAPGAHVGNPFVGAKGYVNPDYAASVSAAAAARGGALGAKMQTVASVSTAVWMDRIAAITAGRGLRGHLDAALAQQTGNQPVVATFVVYDLPNRDCAALASNGELKVSQNGLARYKAEYIDPIAALLGDPKYRDLRIVTVVEPDSLPNLVTNLSNPACAEANSSGAYVQGIQYALNRLHAIPNVYTYLDIAHSAWLGWDSNFGPAVTLIANTIKGTTAGVNSVDGFISNTANYTPTDEPHLPNSNLSVGGQPLRSATFYEWNPYLDEADFGAAMYTAFVQAGLPGTIGMLIDTSRNGWGGTARPGAPSTSTDLNTYTNQSKIDQRIHRGNWCNQNGAGIGARPTTNPLPHFDAYVWIKPPGESDGSSTAIPNDEGKGFDRMCDPTFRGGQQANGGNLTGALPNSPIAGKWFDAQFEMLVQNAFPAL